MFSELQKVMSVARVTKSYGCAFSIIQRLVIQKENVIGNVIGDLLWFILQDSDTRYAQPPTDVSRQGNEEAWKVE